MGGTVIAYVALGANLGDAAATVLKAMDDMNGLPNTRVTRRSSLYRTAPVDAGGPDYVNAVVELSTALAPEDLLDSLQQLELDAGRQRPYRNAPRTLDLDILLFGDLSVNNERLTIPHPRMPERAFVLVPLAEVAPRHVSPRMLQAVAAQPIERLAAV
ncbi:MAG: 2-amino-4-hydroxy-6-hydroxymethyldihydropteridine diphosphokinase [Burkholderiales bacterium]|nr:MAG: 2-amino-4-hydroxy-6-hydroxymethyldihydropteridine diphosphokinase [Burkholderiales bacterium]